MSINLLSRGFCDGLDPASDRPRLGRVLGPPVLSRLLEFVFADAVA
jgi:hypothetical protein